MPHQNGLLQGYVNIQYPRIWYYGDVDKNDGVEALDAAIVLQYSVGIDPVLFAPLPWQTWRLITANVDASLTIDSYDAALILQYCVDIIEEFPADSRLDHQPPPASVRLLVNDNSLSIFACDNVFSLDLELPPVVTNTTVTSNFLWADNNSSSYKFAAASAQPLPSDQNIASFQLNRPVKAQEIRLNINGVSQQILLESADLPCATELYPVAPNPLLLHSGRTALGFAFALAQNGMVKLNIYNIKGQKVKSLIDQYYPAGEHQINWLGDNDNGKTVSSGVYFAAFQSGNYDSKRKFILLK
jgi:hypothetical protein